jgi:hypothetical protein
MLQEADELGSPERRTFRGPCEPHPEDSEEAEASGAASRSVEKIERIDGHLHVRWSAGPIGPAGLMPSISVTLGDGCDYSRGI